MSKSQGFGHFAEFTGINNYADPTRLSQNELISAENVNIDDIGVAYRRDGYASLSGTATRSLWSQGNLCFCVQGRTIYSVSNTFSLTAVVTGLSTVEPVVFERINNDVVYTNGIVIGYITGLAGNSFPAPSDPLKSIMPPGQLLEYFNGRLYVARGGFVFYSDPMYIGATQRRKNFIQFPGYITMLRCVADGLYVSAGDSTYFLSGLSPEKFTLVDIDTAPAYMGTDVDMSSDLIGDGTAVPGNAVMWTSKNGVCAGGDGGRFVNLTLKKYVVSTAAQGAGVFRVTPDNINQYISVLQS